MHRRLIATAAVLAAAVLLPASGAAARATTETFSWSYTDSLSGLTDDCTGATGGVLTVNGTLTGRSTRMNGGEVIKAVDAQTVRIDFSNGSYFLGTSLDNLAIVNTPSSVGVFTNAHVDGGTSYAADGSPLASVVFRATEHTTITGDGQVRTSFERGRLTCS